MPEVSHNSATDHKTSIAMYAAAVQPRFNFFFFFLNGKSEGYFCHLVSYLLHDSIRLI